MGVFWCLGRGFPESVTPQTFREMDILVRDCATLQDGVCLKENHSGSECLPCPLRGISSEERPDSSFTLGLNRARVTW